MIMMYVSVDIDGRGCMHKSFGTVHCWWHRFESHMSVLPQLAVQILTAGSDFLNLIFPWEIKAPATDNERTD